MTEIPSYVNRKFETYKPKKRRRRNCSSSMLYILLSIFTYFMIFYVFELSPSSIFKDTKVLFFISNTLLLIIIADYGDFTDKESHNFYDQYTAVTATMRSRVDHYSPIVVRENLREVEIKNPKDVVTKNPKVEEEEHFTEKESHNFCDQYTTVTAATMRSRIEQYSSILVQENPIAVEVKNPKDVETKNPKVEEEGEEEGSMVKEIICVSSSEKIVRVLSEEEPREGLAKQASDARNNVNLKGYRRSKSEKPRRKRMSEGRDQRKRKSCDRRKSLDSSKWMIVPEKWENVEEESEEFSKMSNEELNRRVEDFIQRFNRQIRSQSRDSSP